jgi:hypothetical protein
VERARTSLILAGVLVGTALAGCVGSGGADGRPLLDLPQYSPDGLRLVYSDTNDDGRPDVLKFFRDVRDADSGVRTSTLVRTELDLNGDGRTNLRRTYDSRGELALEEMDGDLDGRMDHTVYWENGIILRTESDTDGNGWIDEHREYRDGYLSLVRTDTDGNGVIDTWSYYDHAGIVRVGVDSNGDGEADRWSRRSE